MTAVFLYGTLRHPPLLQTVLGASPAPGRLQPARLAGHAARERADGTGATLVPVDGGAAEGLLLPDPSQDERRRLDAYEAAEGRTGRAVTVEAADAPVAARVYDGAQDEAAKAPFDLADWAGRQGALAVDAAAETMARHAQGHDADRLRGFRSFIRGRAWAQRLAQRVAPATLRSGRGEVEIIETRAGWEGFFRVAPFTLRHRRFDGSQSRVFGREVLVSFDVALVLPYDPASDCVLMIEQLRFGTLMRGDPAPWVLEPVAGFIEAGEEPETAARRETEEEARLSPDRLIAMPKVYASPGYSTEFFHCFLALCDLSGLDKAQGGLATENEDIRIHVVPFDDALALIDTGEVNVAPLALMLLWLARARDGLRAEVGRG